MIGKILVNNLVVGDTKGLERVAQAKYSARADG